MNTTNISHNSSYTYDEVFTHTLGIIQGSLYIPIFCAGIGNNILTILIISLNPDMKTVTNCYLLNLAISDILPLIVSLPFEISFLPIEVPWGHLGCQIRALFAETSTNASILTISAFTIERYLAVCGPFRISSLSTIQRAIKVQLLIWFIAILSSTPYFYFTKKIDQQCFFDGNFQIFVTICLHISATCFFLLPAFILFLLYALMARRLYNVGLLHEVHYFATRTTDLNSLSLNAKQNRSIGYRPEQQRFQSVHHSLSRALTFPRQMTFHNGNYPPSRLLLHIQAMKKSAFKMLFAVVIAFIICYAPLHIQRLITSRLNPAHLSLVQQRAITIFYFISGLFYYIGSTVNPIFYHLFSRKYRLAFNRTMKKILHCKRRRQKQNLERAKKLSLLRHHPNTTSRLRRKPTAPIYRPSNRLNINSDRRKLLRISSSPYAQERMH
ncbi:unnamed protein product [Rotaria magnacalcarata]|uniref:G-protein coupled receptors family 1 profile domain-containing protein n=6 Tax=Rotaria magnacalcarata TaxID=392030 RepID=A0A816UTG9_9BILA|nr:unnamed protein product [Rotaria magnacalcarata]CAF1487484.1 unnamed protein product [Rotaria magnacalcarata]CAF1935240.1 unnamed protein product [Rotaria magnacalcarata]CAF2092608.1 unnamed protein product [Rotaria magnacalcarata]CAF2116065.1 unnamed protein product [Rotaria magnacalcarata]